jgi:regulator of protease activity HflC (stomatin/prohibitin superfamily)
MQIILFIAVIIILLFAVINFRRCTILEYQQGLLYQNGKFVSTLNPGNHLYFRPIQSITKVDKRIIHVTLAGQEILSQDNIGIKISVSSGYRITDAYIAINKVQDYKEALYLQIQINLRDIIGMQTVDELLVKREEIGKLLLEKSLPQAAEIGIELLTVNIKDIMFPGELKNIFSQVVNAKNEGLAALERARGESAALRNLANAAGVFNNNPNLMQLRLIQALEKGSGNTVVIMLSEGGFINKIVEKSGK